MENQKFKVGDRVRSIGVRTNGKCGIVKSVRTITLVTVEIDGYREQHIADQELNANNLEMENNECPQQPNE